MSQTTTPTGTPYGTLPPASPLPQRRPISLPRLAQMREAGEKITMLTAYDATFAAVADAAGVECILVGDSLGMVCQGLPSTVGVQLDTMAYHTESVTRGLHRVQGTAWVVADLPFGSYHESREQALRSASRLMQAGAHMVKLEGGGWTAPTVQFLVERGGWEQWVGPRAVYSNERDQREAAAWNASVERSRVALPIRREGVTSR